MYFTHHIISHDGAGQLSNTILFRAGRATKRRGVLHKNLLSKKAIQSEENKKRQPNHVFLHSSTHPRFYHDGKESGSTTIVRNVPGRR